MEIIEKKYRETPVGHNKYVKRLTTYINDLVSKGRIIEAKHFFCLLYEKKPSHDKTIRLGYSLSIASFDNVGVKKFDKKLYDSKPLDIELTWFRLKYYLSVNNRKHCEDSCALLLSKTIKKEYLDTIIEACMNQSNYVIAVHLVRHFEKNRLKLSDKGNKRIKKIVLQRLLDSIEGAKYG